MMQSLYHADGGITLLAGRIEPLILMMIGSCLVEKQTILYSS